MVCFLRHRGSSPVGPGGAAAALLHYDGKGHIVTVGLNSTLCIHEALDGGRADASSPECLLTVYWYACTHTPHLPPRPGHSFPDHIIPVHPYTLAASASQTVCSRFTGAAPWSCTLVNGLGTAGRAREEDVASV